jgi:oligopeptide/dipeptide ABC transporter ATP-binding protein
MCDKLAVMYAGRIVEQGAVKEIFRNPQHPYTKALLGSIPKIGSKEPLFAIPGQPPNLASLPQGCYFHPRCPEAMDRCRMDEPPVYAHGDQWEATCWLLDGQNEVARQAEGVAS